MSKKKLKGILGVGFVVLTGFLYYKVNFLSMGLNLSGSKSSEKQSEASLRSGSEENRFSDDSQSEEIQDERPSYQLSGQAPEHENNPSTNSAHEKYLKLPSIEKVNGEENSEMNVPSLSVIEFSSEITKKTQTALESEESAHSLFQELEGCIHGPADQVHPSIRNICLSHARILGTAYPELGSRLGSLKDVGQDMTLSAEDPGSD